jgi:hypothetical protein
MEHEAVKSTKLMGPIVSVTTGLPPDDCVTFRLQLPGTQSVLLKMAARSEVFTVNDSLPPPPTALKLGAG